jgi:hypothetical protein
MLEKHLSNNGCHFSSKNKLLFDLLSPGHCFLSLNIFGKFYGRYKDISYIKLEILSKLPKLRAAHINRLSRWPFNWHGQTARNFAMECGWEFGTLLHWSPNEIVGVKSNWSCSFISRTALLIISYILASERGYLPKAMTQSGLGGQWSDYQCIVTPEGNTHQPSGYIRNNCRTLTILS